MNNKTPANRFTRTFYVANTLEIFERIAWYGFFMVSTLYVSTSSSAGSLGFSGTELFSIASLFVDSRETVLEHIGELLIPIAQGVVKASDVMGDLYELV